MSIPLEWEILVWWVEHKPERLIARLDKNLVKDGDCRLWVGSHNGDRGGRYGRLSFKWNGGYKWIYAHRLFLMLMLRHPIPDGWHASHDHTICQHRNCVSHIFIEWGNDNRAEAIKRWRRKSR